MRYEKQILESLIEKFYRNERDCVEKKGRVFVRPSEIEKSYDSRTCPIPTIDSFNDEALKCEKESFVDIDWGTKKNVPGLRIKRLLLNEENVEKAEEYLEETYAYNSIRSIREEAEALIKTYDTSKTSAALITDDIAKRVRKASITKNEVKKYADVLKVTDFLEENEENLYPREISQRLFGDTKYMERNALFDAAEKVFNAVCGHRTGNDGYDPDILRNYHIIRDTEIFIKGNVDIRLKGQDVCLSAFTKGIAFFSDDVFSIENIQVRDETFMTVENFTSWKKLGARGVTFFYLGGYADSRQTEFLAKVFKDNPEIRYLHFGDIDPYGFDIFKNLCERTGIPFETYMMDEDVLKDERYRGFLKPLTKEDISHMKALSDDPAFHDIAVYMSDNNVKLEQEAVSLELART